MPRAQKNRVVVERNIIYGDTVIFGGSNPFMSMEKMYIVRPCE
jgi:hypothetical protein